MISYGPILWHLAVAGLLLVVRALSTRLGKAMRDDIGDVRFFTWAAILISLAGVLQAAAVFWAEADLASSVLGLFGFALAGRAGWKTWGWIPTELKRGR